MKRVERDTDMEESYSLMHTWGNMLPQIHFVQTRGISREATEQTDQ